MTDETTGKTPKPKLEGRTIYTEMELEDGSVLATGDRFRVSNEVGAVFTFKQFVVNVDAQCWVIAYGGSTGSAQWRAFHPHRVRVDRGSSVLTAAATAAAAGRKAEEASPMKDIKDRAKQARSDRAASATEPEPEPIDSEPAASEDDSPAPAAPAPDAPTPAPVPTGTGFLAELVADGRLVVGQVVNHKGGFEATVTEDGMLEYAGTIYNSATKASEAAWGKPTTSGWQWWRVEDGRRLRDVRDRLEA